MSESHNLGVHFQTSFFLFLCLRVGKTWTPHVDGTLGHRKVTLGCPYQTRDGPTHLSPQVLRGPD